MSDLDTADVKLSYATDSYDSALLPRHAGPQMRTGSRFSDQNGLVLELDGTVPVQAHLRPVHAVRLIIKRVIDIVVSAGALVVLLPLLVILAVLIKTKSPGPVFFRQERQGRDGRIFKALKLRSMHIELSDFSGVAQTVENDPRVTDLGRFMRKTSIDELPQLLNVLWGDMSLVGPRPHVAGMMAGGTTYKKLVPYYDQRLAVVPGLTGWAQANGLRGPTDRADLARARINHDIAYIQNFSIWLDMKIIFMTLRQEFFGGSGH